MVSLLAIVVAVTGLLTRNHSTSDSVDRVVPAPVPSAPRPGADRAVPPPSSGREVDDAVAAIARTPRYPAAPAATRITGITARQPDLYAAEFVRRLLTRDYTRPREEQLRWVQAESATTTEPLVIGLVPDHLRDRFAIWSVTGATDGPAPVPPPPEWARLGAVRAVDTATVERVQEPTAWIGAVQAGRITDPGITARQVSATVTRRTGATTQTFSVSASLNLEGPPVRPTWGVVAVITYTAIPVSTS
ncbi:hypothetical protein ASG95_20245 [Phycicoccus sp. Soil803]|nr:hypothetical protein ASG95_20245 [Phycicoccus sp. Soil803]